MPAYGPAPALKIKDAAFDHVESSDVTPPLGYMLSDETV